MLDMERNTDSDHDLLISLHEQVKGLRSDIQSLSTTNDNYKLDHEQRLRTLESFKSVIFGGLVLSNATVLPVLIWLVIRALGGSH